MSKLFTVTSEPTVSLVYTFGGAKQRDHPKHIERLSLWFQSPKSERSLLSSQPGIDIYEICNIVCKSRSELLVSLSVAILKFQSSSRCGSAVSRGNEGYPGHMPTDVVSDSPPRSVPLSRLRQEGQGGQPQHSPNHNRVVPRRWSIDALYKLSGAGEQPGTKRCEYTGLPETTLASSSPACRGLNRGHFKKGNSTYAKAKSPHISLSRSIE